MTDFVVYTTNIFSNLNNSNTQILEANINTYYINSITICNISDNAITINLTKSILSSPEQTAYLVKSLQIPAAQGTNLSTIDLVKYFGLEVFLPVQNISNNLIGSSLNIYSGGINQVFDCTIDYSILTELPITN